MLKYNTQKQAGMAELADALDLGSSGNSRGGSSPSTRTRIKNILTKAIEIIKIYNCDAGVAELADAQDLKSWDLNKVVPVQVRFPAPDIAGWSSW